jgi:hypothetical protein
MSYSKKNPLIRLICFVMLALGISVSSANPEEISSESGLPTPLYRSMGQPLTDIETMELHQRRFIDAANSVAKLFSQFDQKVHDVVQAARAVSASPYNERAQDQLLYKARQMGNAQQSFDSRYLQLQAKMQYEFRNFIATSNVFMSKQDKIKN